MCPCVPCDSRRDRLRHPHDTDRPPRRLVLRVDVSLPHPPSSGSHRHRHFMQPSLTGSTPSTRSHPNTRPVMSSAARAIIAPLPQRLTLGQRATSTSSPYPAPSPQRFAARGTPDRASREPLRNQTTRAVRQTYCRAIRPRLGRHRRAPRWLPASTDRPSLQPSPVSHSQPCPHLPTPRDRTQACFHENNDTTRYNNPYRRRVMVVGWKKPPSPLPSRAK